jgi:hypothetical protein
MDFMNIVIGIILISIIFFSTIDPLCIRHPLNQIAGDLPSSDGNIYHVKWLNSSLEQDQIDRYNPIESGQDPTHQLPFLGREFGLPDAIDASKGGEAIWNRPTLKKRHICWERVTISDLPSNFIVISYKLPFKKTPQLSTSIRELDSIATGIEYDASRNVLKVSGNNTKNIVALLVICKRVLGAEINKKQAIEHYKILKSYLNLASDLYQPQMYNLLHNELCSDTQINDLKGQIDNPKAKSITPQNKL